VTNSLGLSAAAAGMASRGRPISSGCGKRPLPGV